VSVGYFETGYSAQSVAARGSKVFLASTQNGLWILQNDLLVPVYLRFLTAERRDGQAVVRWEVAQLPDRTGFHVWRQEPAAARVRITDSPLAGALVYEFADPGPPAGEGEYWLQMIEPEGSETWLGSARLAPLPPEAARFDLAPNFPNPFNPRTRIRFTVPDGGKVALRILDLRGRVVITLVDGDVTPGEHQVAWDGCDADGRAVASGTYLARLESDTALATRKLLLAR